MQNAGEHLGSQAGDLPDVDFFIQPPAECIHRLDFLFPLQRVLRVELGFGRQGAGDEGGNGHDHECDPVTRIVDGQRPVGRGKKVIEDQRRRQRSQYAAGITAGHPGCQQHCQ